MTDETEKIEEYVDIDILAADLVEEILDCDGVSDWARRDVARKIAPKLIELIQFVVRDMKSEIIES